MCRVVYDTTTTSMLDFIFHSAIRPIYWWNSYWIARLTFYECSCTGVFVCLHPIKSSVYRSFVRTYIRTNTWANHYIFTRFCRLPFRTRCDWSIDEQIIFSYTFSASILGFRRIFVFFCFLFLFFCTLLWCVSMCMFVCIFMLIHSLACTFEIAKTHVR